jgi:hypothetical protein
MKTEVSINGQDYSWQGADLYSKSSTKPIWKKIKSYESDIVSVSQCNNGLQIETINDIMQTDLIGTIRIKTAKHKSREISEQKEDAENPKE